MSSLGELLPEEIKRVLDLRDLYVELGPPGMIGAALMRAAIHRALDAYKSGDVVEMLHAYQDLKGCEG